MPYSYAEHTNQAFQNAQLVPVQGERHWIDHQFNQTAIPAIDTFLYE